MKARPEGAHRVKRQRQKRLTTPEFKVTGVPLMEATMVAGEAS
jgi:hypothetical protein